MTDVKYIPHPSSHQDQPQLGFNVPPLQPAYGNPPPYTEHPTAQPAVITQPRTTVITTQPTVVVIKNLGSKPTACFCNVCDKQVVTEVENASTVRTHLIAAILCLFGCWCCVCVPYCVDSCKKTFHSCPQCKTYMGSN